MLPSFQKLSLSALSTSPTSVGLQSDEEFVKDFEHAFEEDFVTVFKDEFENEFENDMTANDIEFALLHDLTAIELMREKSLHIDMKRMRQSSNNPNRKQRSETLRMAMFGLGPYTPSTSDEIQYLLNARFWIYKAKNELITFMHQKFNLEVYNVNKERMVFYRILVMLREAFKLGMNVNSYQLYTSMGSKNVDIYLEELKRVQRRLNKILDTRESKYPDQPKMIRTWEGEFNLMDTRSVQTSQRKVVRFSELYVRDAVKTLFYFVKLQDSRADTMTLMPMREQNVSLFGMNAKTWHAVSPEGGFQWAWLVLLPLNLRHDLYNDDLSNHNQIKIHLQHETQHGENLWRPDVKGLEKIPLVLVFHTSTFLGYYYYTGFTEDESRDVPPRAILHRISPVQ